MCRYIISSWFDEGEEGGFVLDFGLAHLRMVRGS